MRLTLPTLGLLSIPPLLWAANVVVGRMVVDIVPPVTLNFLRWLVAFFLLLPLAAWVLRRDSPLWTHWRRFALLGLLGFGCFNALQYAALHTSSAINVTLVMSTMPLWMLALGQLFFHQRTTRRELAGVLLSIAGVVVVLTGGQWQQIGQWRPVPGDLIMVVAALIWAAYSWLLLPRPDEPATIRSDWAAFLLAQVVFGAAWSALFAAGEWAMSDARPQWGWPLLVTVAFVAIAPSVLAYRAWGLGVTRAGPVIAGVFFNSMPLFAAVLSGLLLREWPQPFHLLAFGLIVAGIVVTSRG